MRRPTRRFFCQTAVLAALPLAASPAAAQSDDREPPAPPPGTEATGELEREQQPSLRFELRGAGLHQFETDIDSGGEVAVTHAGLGLNVSHALAGGHQLSGGVSAIWSNYDLSLPASLSPDDDLFDDALRAQVSLGLGGPISEGWQYRVGGTVGFAGEPDADIGDAFVWSGVASVSRIVSPDLVLGLGLGVASRIEEDPIIFPVPIIRWSFAERWTLATGATDSLLLAGPAASLTFAANDQVSFRASVSYANTTLRLDDDAAISEGVFEMSGVPITGQIVWTPTPELELHVLGGVIIAGEIETRTSSGSTVGDEDVDPQTFVGVEARFRF